MRIDILTLFPNMFEPLKESIIERATKNNKLTINIINIRDYSKDKHKKCDDYTFGGGPGMLMMPQPIYDAMTSIEGYEKAHKIYMSPKGKVFTQKQAQSLAKNYEHLIILCGHYEGVDERIIEMLIDEEISIGDYVLTGGELPAMVVVDALSRNISGVLGGDDSAEIESFSDNLFEYPLFSNPRDFMGHVVPDVLISGDHGKVDKWRREQAELITKKRRPDLLNKEEK